MNYFYYLPIFYCKFYFFNWQSYFIKVDNNFAGHMFLALDDGVKLIFVFAG